MPPGAPAGGAERPPPRPPGCWPAHTSRIPPHEIKKLGNINIIFCSDNYILDVNVKYLGHDYFTDIITFDYCEKDILSGDLFISIDTVRDNAEFYKTEFNDELNRVIVHGLLHLIGYDDHTPEEQKIMREKENYYLELRNHIEH